MVNFLQVGLATGKRTFDTDMKTFSTILIVSLLTSISARDALPADRPANSRAKAAEKADGAKTEKKGRGLPFHGHIAAVDKTAKTITMRGEKQRKFHVTTETKINRDKKPSAFASIMVGEYVGGYSREAADGRMELVTLNVGTPASKGR